MPRSKHKFIKRFTLHTSHQWKRTELSNLIKKYPTKKITRKCSDFMGCFNIFRVRISLEGRAGEESDGKKLESWQNHFDLIKKICFSLVPFCRYSYDE